MPLHWFPSLQLSLFTAPVSPSWVSLDGAINVKSTRLRHTHANKSFEAAVLFEKLLL